MEQTVVPQSVQNVDLYPGGVGEDGGRVGLLEGGGGGSDVCGVGDGAGAGEAGRDGGGKGSRPAGLSGGDDGKGGRVGDKAGGVAGGTEGGVVLVVEGEDGVLHVDGVADRDDVASNAGTDGGGEGSRPGGGGSGSCSTCGTWGGQGVAQHAHDNQEFHDG